MSWKPSDAIRRPLKLDNTAATTAASMNQPRRQLSSSRIQILRTDDTTSSLKNNMNTYNQTSSYSPHSNNDSHSPVGPSAAATGSGTGAVRSSRSRSDTLNMTDRPRRIGRDQ